MLHSPGPLKCTESIVLDFYVAEGRVRECLHFIDQKKKKSVYIFIVSLLFPQIFLRFSWSISTDVQLLLKIFVYFFWSFLKLQIIMH